MPSWAVIPEVRSHAADLAAQLPPTSGADEQALAVARGRRHHRARAKIRIRRLSQISPMVSARSARCWRRRADLWRQQPPCANCWRRLRRSSSNTRRHSAIWQGTAYPSYKAATIPAAEPTLAEAIQEALGRPVIVEHRLSCRPSRRVLARLRAVGGLFTGRWYGRERGRGRVDASRETYGLPRSPYRRDLRGGVRAVPHGGGDVARDGPARRPQP
jgi:hypothetical protein